MLAELELIPLGRAGASVTQKVASLEAKVGSTLKKCAPCRKQISAVLDDGISVTTSSASGEASASRAGRGAG